MNSNLYFFFLLTVPLQMFGGIAVKVSGAVAEPGTYTLTDSEGLCDLIVKAGGFTTTPNHQFESGTINTTALDAHITIIRHYPLDNSEIHGIDPLAAIKEESDIILHDGEEILVKKNVSLPPDPFSKDAKDAGPSVDGLEEYNRSVQQFSNSTTAGISLETFTERNSESRTILYPVSNDLILLMNELQGEDEFFDFTKYGVQEPKVLVYDGEVLIITHNVENHKIIKGFLAVFEDVVRIQKKTEPVGIVNDEAAPHRE